MNRTINIALKIGFVCVSFVMGAMISYWLLFVLFIALGNRGDIFLGWVMMIITALMIGVSYAFRNTFHWFNPRHRSFRRFIQFLLFQLILSFLHAIGFGFSVYSAYWRIIYRQFKWPILDPHLHTFIQFLVVLLSMVAITAAVRIIFQALSRMSPNVEKSAVLFTAITLLMLQITITLFLGATLLFGGTSGEESSFSPDGTREIRRTYPVGSPYVGIYVPDDDGGEPTFNRSEFISGGVIFITKSAYFPVWKAIDGRIIFADPGESPTEFIWSKDSSKVYIVSKVDRQEFNRKGIHLMSIYFGYDFRSDRKLPSETACNDYRELPDLILPNLTCPQKPER